jgi:hypothetical protein
MSSAVYYGLVADRDCPFSDSFARVGVNWSTATFFMQVKAEPDAGGSALLTLTLGGGLTLAYAGTDTIANHIAAGRLARDILRIVNPTTGAFYANADSVAFSKVNVALTSTQTNSLPATQETGDDWIGAYDLRVDPAGGALAAAAKEFYGSFTLRGTVTK